MYEKIVQLKMQAHLKTRLLQEKDLDQCVDLDKKWFGDHGISKEDLRKNLDTSLGIFDHEKLQGFATFEILDGVMPSDYVGDIKPDGKIFFIQQFTTTTNYKKEDSSVDEALLTAVEQKAKELGCAEIWEALAIDHPYSAEKNPQFDAFGFYESHGFNMDKNTQVSWNPSKSISISCYVFRK